MRFEIPETTKALRLHGAEDLRLESVDVPTLGDDDALFETKAIGLCASDGKLFHAGDGHARRQGSATSLAEKPVIICHEWAGIAVAKGRNVGDAVELGGVYTFQAALFDPFDGRKSKALGYFLDGAATQYARLGREVIQGGYLIPAPANLGYGQIAIAEPWACVYHAYENHRDSRSVLPGGNTWVIGAGPLGLMHLEKAIKARPARVYVSEFSAVRLGKLEDTYAAMARAQGVDLEIIDLRSQGPQEVIPDESLDDVILAASVAQAAAGSFPKLNKGGFANLFAGIPKEEARISLDLHWMHYHDITLIATSGSTIPNFQEALKDASEGAIDPNNVIAAVGGMDAIKEAFRAVLEGTYPGKVVVYPQIEHPLTGVTNWTIEGERDLLGSDG